MKVVEIEGFKSSKRAVRRSASFSKWNSRLAEYKQTGMLWCFEEDPQWVRFLAKNTFAYRNLVSEGWSKNYKFKGHPKNWGFNNKKAVSEALSLA